MAQTTQITVHGQRTSPQDFLQHAGGPVESLYVHVPFCFHKCHYCDFYSFVDRQDRQEEFTRVLVRELAGIAAALPAPDAGRHGLRTVFVGGGTPSLLRPELWERFLEGLWSAFEPLPELEFTVECNPETVSTELMAVLRGGGVNRVSIGAQSFDERHLRTLERWHDPANVPRALNMTREAGIARQSIDLIYGIPGQTLEEWDSDLARAIELQVEHVSCYALTYEPNTPMTARLGRGEFEAAGDDLEVQMMQLCLERLGAAGLERYEVSNFARPGRESEHNLAYWRHGEWLAAGPSASGHVAGHRWKNVPRLTDWIKGVEARGYSPAVDVELPDASRALCERLMMGLRLREGLDATSVLHAAGELGCADALRNAGKGLVARGWMLDESGRWQLTDAGFFFADGAAAELMDAIQ